MALKYLFNSSIVLLIVLVYITDHFRHLHIFNLILKFYTFTYFYRGYFHLVGGGGGGQKVTFPGKSNENNSLLYFSYFFLYKMYCNKNTISIVS